MSKIGSRLDKIVESFQINGFSQNFECTSIFYHCSLVPLIRIIAQKSRKKNPYLVFLAGAPGSGKSTLAAFLAKQLRLLEGIEAQALGLDGFHFSQDELKKKEILEKGKRVCLIERKGCPESFNSVAFLQALAALQNGLSYWPTYDRILHDISDQMILVKGQVLLIEGNWLLLQESPWDQAQCDFSIWLEADQDLLKRRLIDRKRKGGLSLKEAYRFYEQSDRLNVIRCLAAHRQADVCLKVDEFVRKETR